LQVNALFRLVKFIFFVCEISESVKKYKCMRNHEYTDKTKPAFWGMPPLFRQMRGALYSSGFGCENITGVARKSVIF